MAKIEQGRFAEQIRRLLNLASNQGPQDIAPEINAVFVLENDRPEWGIHKAENWVRQTASAAGGAAAVAKVQLRNPVTSGALVVVHEAGWTSGAIRTRLRLIQTTTDLATVAGLTGVRIDTRRYGGGAVTGGGALIASTTSVDAAADAGFNIHTADSTVEVLSPPYTRSPVVILAPGYALQWQTQSVGVVNLAVSCLYTERGMSAAERVL